MSKEAIRYITATLAAFGPDEAISMTKETWAKLHEAMKALAEQPAQQALDKMAENARELGLDYEPVWGGGPSNKDYEDAMRLRRLNELAKPAQRNPLTDDEIHQCFLASEQGQDGTEFRKAFARAIEAKLRSKNEDRN